MVKFPSPSPRELEASTRLAFYEILAENDLAVSSAVILSTPNPSLGLVGIDEGRLSEQDPITQCRLPSVARSTRSSCRSSC